MILRTLVVFIGLLLMLASPASAQSCNGQFTAGQVCGNAAGGLAPPNAQVLSPLFDRNFGAPSAQGTILNRGASVWGATISSSSLFLHHQIFWGVICFVLILIYIV